jgi:hypothetical protein
MGRVYASMPYSRQRPRVAPTGRIGVRLTTAQRDLFVQAKETPQDVAHALRRAPVKAGKLSLRLKREELESLIAAAVNTRARDNDDERALATLVRYLEGLEKRFEVVEPSDAGAAEVADPRIAAPDRGDGAD